MHVLPMGVQAVLVEDPPGSPAAWADALRLQGLPGVIDVVPAERTVLVRCRDEGALAHATSRFGSIVPSPAGSDTRSLVTIEVVYDGADLASVAAATGMSADEVVALHAGADYQVAFCGFAPGFGYLNGLPEPLHLPRRSSPRTRVPAGSVAIAAQYSAVYPRSSPGGWHLLGRTQHVMFDVDRDEPSTLHPGAAVKFHPVR